MGKNDLFDHDLNSKALLFKALGHPARLAILKYLAEIKVCMTGDISDEIPLSRTTVNQHLKALKDAGLIQGSVNGVKVNYCLNPKKILEVKNITDNFFKELSSSHHNSCT